MTLPIQPFQITQIFGVNASSYTQFGLKGHNGWDVRTIYVDSPNGHRPILAPQDAVKYKQGNEGAVGYGLYFEVITRTPKGIWKHTFAHCKSIEPFAEKKEGQTMAISDNTGNSTASHLHWTVKRLNPDMTVRDYNNGFFGAINPQEYINEVNSSQPTPPMNDDRPYFFDLTWLDEHPGSDTRKVTKAQVDEQIVLNRTRKEGNGKWDIICKLAGLDTKSTPQQGYDAIKATGFDKKSFVEKIITEIRKL